MDYMDLYVRRPKRLLILITHINDHFITEISVLKIITVFKTDGHPVAIGNQKLGWTSQIWSWANKNYNRLYWPVGFLSCLISFSKKCQNAKKKLAFPNFD